MKNTRCLFLLFVIISAISCKKAVPANLIKNQKLVQKEPGTAQQLSAPKAENTFIPETALICEALLVPNPTPKSNMQVAFFIDTNSMKKWVFIDSLYHPFASSSSDYNIFAVRCLQKHGNWCKIVINEVDGTELWYDLSNKALVLQSWEDHILHVFSIEVDRLQNPLKEKPSIKANKVSLQAFKEQEYLHPSAITEDWLKVEIGDTGKYAWVKWREGNKLLVELFYMA